jgi:uncharacterized protein YidB (DUF937 family)
MGLIDIINGMQNGPRGQTAPAQPGSGGISPIAMALIGVLAYKAIKHLGAGQTAGTPAPNAAPSGGGLGGMLSGGGLGGLLSGPLGGLLAGGAAGGLVSGGLNDLLKQFQQSGQSGAVKSWIGTGPNQEISPNDLSKALGQDQINTLAAHTGMSSAELLAALSQHLPELINQLTPNGRLPTEQEASRLG